MREFLLLVTLAVIAYAQPVVATAQYDNQRTGANPAETILSPRNVNPLRFGKQFVVPLDGDVYAQPLYVPNLEIPGRGMHSVMFVATEHDSIYAIDAEGQPLAPLWHVSFINPAAGVNPVAERDMQCPFISPEVGITSTPVIDAATHTIYVLGRTAEQGRDGKVRFYQRLHALDLTTGTEKQGSPVLIRASVATTSFVRPASKGGQLPCAAGEPSCGAVALRQHCVSNVGLGLRRRPLPRLGAGLRRSNAETRRRIQHLAGFRRKRYLAVRRWDRG